MPTYTVTVANLSLSQQQKSQIAEAITTAHSTQTGAPRFFAQVLFFLPTKAITLSVAA
ncbi:tautomerase family protein [uncultured Marinobacter sp.]|uniref:tautomerase family protein n=1 Tax=uncultured Marinobacter sp. TaxID=187379 RepID=UPI002583465C|nr:tautomerase family protein [uncultured Marinobacter sp.]